MFICLWKCPFSFSEKSTCFKHKPSVQTERKILSRQKVENVRKLSPQRWKCTHSGLRNESNSVIKFNVLFVLVHCKARKENTAGRGISSSSLHCIMMKKENERDILLPFAGACFGARLRWVSYELSTRHCKSGLLSEPTQGKRQFSDF